MDKKLLEEELKEIALSPDQLTVHDQNSLDLQVMALRLHKHTLQEMQEAFTSKQQGRKPNFFMPNTNLLLAECNILCDKIIKAADTGDLGLDKKGDDLHHQATNAQDVEPDKDTGSGQADPAVAECAVAAHALTNKIAIEPAVTYPAVTEPAVTESAVTDPAVIEPAVTDLAVFGNAVSRQEMTVKYTKLQEMTVKDSLMQMVRVKNPSIKRIAKSPRDEDTFLASDQNKAAKVQLMGDRFLARQLLYCLKENNLSGTLDTPVVIHISSSKCLNDTNRAFLLKLEAATLLASVHLASTWFSHAGGASEPLKESMTANFAPFIFWSSGCLACWLEALFSGSVLTIW